MRPETLAAIRDRLRLAGELGALYSATGRPCEVEAGLDGVLVYASTRVDAERVARSIQKAVLPKDARAQVLGPERASDEPPATTWWAEVSFDWRKI